MKKLLTFTIIFVLLISFLSVGASIWLYTEYQKKGPLEQTEFFIVNKGQGVSKIADQLFESGIIEDPYLFRIASRLSGADTKIKAGEYQFSSGISMSDILRDMKEGSVYQHRFTIPEGLTSWQIVQRLNEVDGLEGEIVKVPEEGSLLPETYSYMRGDTRQEKLAQMQEAMSNTIDELFSAEDKQDKEKTLSRSEILVLASIIEKETAVSDERERISGVFHNRLKKGMKLQTDPTVIYAITKGKIQEKGKGPLGRRLLTKDMQFDSKYNTYKYPGLPPGPIANPGRASIEAALNPEQHEYLYFVADGTGGHAFSKTLEEHNKNVTKWRRVRKINANK